MVERRLFVLDLNANPEALPDEEADLDSMSNPEADADRLPDSDAQAHADP